MDNKFLLQKRIDVGLSQARIADILGYSVQTISLWESDKGSPSLPIWGKYASLLKVDLEGLPIIKKELLEGDATSLGMNVDPRKLYDIKEDMTLNDVISLVSRAHATTEGLTKRPITPFEDRDSVFNYYHDGKYLDKETCYQIMEDARKGISLQPYLEKRAYI